MEHDKLVDQAAKYDTRTEFRHGSPAAYRAARAIGVLDELFPKYARKRSGAVVYLMECDGFHVVGQCPPNEVETRRFELWHHAGKPPAMVRVVAPRSAPATVRFILSEFGRKPPVRHDIEGALIMTQQESEACVALLDFVGRV